MSQCAAGCRDCVSPDSSLWFCPVWMWMWRILGLWVESPLWCVAQRFGSVQLESCNVHVGWAQSGITESESLSSEPRKARNTQGVFPFTACHAHGQQGALPFPFHPLLSQPSCFSQVLVNLNDINDNCPTFPRPYEGPFDVTEGQPGPRVWTFLAHDGDSGPSGQVEYSIIAGDPLGEWGHGVSPVPLAAPWRSLARRGAGRKRFRKAILPPSWACRHQEILFEQQET